MADHPLGIMSSLGSLAHSLDTCQGVRSRLLSAHEVELLEATYLSELAAYEAADAAATVAEQLSLRAPDML